MKTIIRFKKIIDHLSASGNPTLEIKALQNGLTLAVRAKHSDIYSKNMKFDLLCQFPDAFTDDEFQAVLVSLVPEWNKILKNKRIEFIEMCLARNSQSFEVLKIINKALKGYLKKKIEVLLAPESPSCNQDKTHFIGLMTKLTDTLIKLNYFDLDLCSGVINSQLEVIKTMDHEDEMPVIVSSLNSLVNFCLKFNYESSELLDLVFMKRFSNESSLSSMDLEGLLRKDLFVYYAGLCGFER